MLYLMKPSMCTKTIFFITVSYFKVYGEMKINKMKFSARFCGGFYNIEIIYHAS